jgi:hypothetical protein
VIESILAELKRIARRLERLEAQERGGIYADWTPTVTQSGAVAITIGEARYCRIGDLVVATAYLTVTGAGTSGQPIVIGGLPFALPAGSFRHHGTILVRDRGTAYYAGVLRRNDDTSLVGTVDGAAGTAIGQSPSFALEEGDNISVQIAYEAT